MAAFLLLGISSARAGTGPAIIINDQLCGVFDGCGGTVFTTMSLQLIVKLLFLMTVTAI
jgi:hypothetical protein